MMSLMFHICLMMQQSLLHYIVNNTRVEFKLLLELYKIRYS